MMIQSPNPPNPPNPPARLRVFIERRGTHSDRYQWHGYAAPLILVSGVRLTYCEPFTVYIRASEAADRRKAGAGTRKLPRELPTPAGVLQKVTGFTQPPADDTKTGTKSNTDTVSGAIG